MPSLIDEADIPEPREVERGITIREEGRKGYASDLYALICLGDRSLAYRRYREAVILI